MSLALFTPDCCLVEKCVTKMCGRRYTALLSSTPYRSEWVECGQNTEQILYIYIYKSTEWPDKRTTNKSIMSFYCSRFYCRPIAQLMPYRIIAIEWDRQKVCQHLIWTHWTILCVTSRTQRNHRVEEKSKIRSQMILAEAIQASASTIWQNKKLLFFAFLLSLWGHDDHDDLVSDDRRRIRPFVARSFVWEFILSVPFRPSFECTTDFVALTKSNLRCVIIWARNGYIHFAWRPQV